MKKTKENLIEIIYSDELSKTDRINAFGYLLDYTLEEIYAFNTLRALKPHNPGDDRVMVALDKYIKEIEDCLLEEGSI